MKCVMFRAMDLDGQIAAASVNATRDAFSGHVCSSCGADIASIRCRQPQRLVAASSSKFVVCGVVS